MMVLEVKKDSQDPKVILASKEDLEGLADLESPYVQVLKDRSTSFLLMNVDSDKVHKACSCSFTNKTSPFNQT